MTMWLVKDLSKLTNVSVQTLHYYDRVGLMKPSSRLHNGYRVYSEKDLLKLQQITALKYFGFSLLDIKRIMEGQVDAFKHFEVQAQLLEEKAKTLLEASQNLKSLLSDVQHQESLPWQTIIHIMEIYHMTKNLEKTWVKNILTPEELKQYAAFEKELKEKSKPGDKEAFTKAWLFLIDEVKLNLDQDPRTQKGADLAKKIMDLVNGVYGTENANLKNAMWERGFKKGKMEDHFDLEPKIVEWIDRATDYYYRERIYHVLDQVEKGETPELMKKWNDIMTEMFGHSEELKQAAYKAGASEHDLRVGPRAKAWLGKHFVK